MMLYNPREWFWIVGGDESRAWSSASASYVTDYPQDRLSRIANEVELYDVLARSNLAPKAPQRTFTASEVRDAFLRIDAVETGDASTALELGSVGENIGMNLPPIV